MDMKDKGLRIRVDQDLRQEFLATCRAQDKPASQVLREFMRQYTSYLTPDLCSHPFSRSMQTTGYDLERLRPT